MRVRTNLIIEEKILEKIDIIAGERNKRAKVIETALLEFIAREESKAVNVFNTETVKSKAASGSRKVEV